MVADLDSVVYGDAGLSHLGRAALWATTTGVIVTVLAFYDPRLTATSRTIESKFSNTTGRSAAVSYLRSRRRPMVRWIRSHRQSYAIMLVWACFYLAVGFWSLLGDPTGYHWVVAGLLAVRGGRSADGAIFPRGWPGWRLGSSVRPCGSCSAESDRICGLCKKVGLECGEDFPLGASRRR